MVVVIIIVVLAIICGLAYVSINNGIIEKENRCDNAWETIETFPGNIVAGNRFKPRHGFEAANDEIREVPSVKF